MNTTYFKLFICFYFLINIQLSFQLQGNRTTNNAESNEEIHDMEEMLTLDTIKRKLKESEIFDSYDQTLSASETEDLKQLFDYIEINMTSRARQPSKVQSTFSTLREIQRIVNKQLKLGKISITLANKFQWHKLSLRQKRQGPAYRLDEKGKMRIFNLDN